MRKIDKNLEKEIIKNYKNGLSMKKISKEFSISITTVFNILKRNNIETRSKGGNSKELIDLNKLKEEYLSGQSTTILAKKYNVTVGTIINDLKKLNIERNNRYKNKNLNEKYFDEINTIDKAYFLGFLITDGSVNKNNNGIALSLKLEDKEILETFSVLCGITPYFSKVFFMCLLLIFKLISGLPFLLYNLLELYKRKGKPEISLKIKSKHMKNTLEKYGIIPQKTEKVYLPILKEEFMSHLIRGMIDGDGSISYKSHYVYFCGNEQCVTQLRDFLVNKLKIFKPKVIQGGPHLFSCQWASHKDILKICEYIYNNKQDCYLQRKYNNYLKIKGNTEVN